MVLQILVDHSKTLGNNPRCRGAGNWWFISCFFYFLVFRW